MFDDAKALAQLGFRYAEPSQPQAFVTATAASMPLYRPAAWLSGPSLLEGAGGPPTLRQLLGGRVGFGLEQVFRKTKRKTEGLAIVASLCDC